MVVYIPENKVDVLKSMLFTDQAIEELTSNIESLKSCLPDERGVIFFQFATDYINEQLLKGISFEQAVSDWLKDAELIYQAMYKERKQFELYDATAVISWPEQFATHFQGQDIFKIKVDNEITQSSNKKKVIDLESVFSVVGTKTLFEIRHLEDSLRLMSKGPQYGLITELNSLNSCYQKIKKQIENLDDVQKENEMIIRNLHSVQEELERVLIKKNELENSKLQLGNKLKKLINRQTWKSWKSWRITKPLRVIYRLLRGKPLRSKNRKAR